jgi:hypothetical protein
MKALVRTMATSRASKCVVREPIATVKSVSVRSISTLGAVYVVTGPAMFLNGTAAVKINFLPSFLSFQMSSSRVQVSRRVPGLDARKNAPSCSNFDKDPLRSKETSGGSH